MFEENIPVNVSVCVMDKEPIYFDGYQTNWYQTTKSQQFRLQNIKLQKRKLQKINFNHCCWIDNLIKACKKDARDDYLETKVRKLWSENLERSMMCKLNKLTGIMNFNMAKDAWDCHSILTHHEQKLQFGAFEPSNFPQFVGDVLVSENVIREGPDGSVNLPIFPTPFEIPNVEKLMSMLPRFQAIKFNNTHSKSERVFQDPVQVNKDSCPLDFLRPLFELLEKSNDIKIDFITIGTIADSGKHPLSQCKHKDLRDNENENTREKYNGRTWLVFIGVEENKKSFIWVWIKDKLTRVQIPYKGAVVIRADTWHAGYPHFHGNFRIFLQVYEKGYSGDMKRPVLDRDDAFQPMILDILGKRDINIDLFDDSFYNTTASVTKAFLNSFVKKRRELFLKFCEILEYCRVKCCSRKRLRKAQNLLSNIQKIEQFFYLSFTTDKGIEKRKRYAFAVNEEGKKRKRESDKDIIL
jgi:hypothetical protein